MARRHAASGGQVLYLYGVVASDQRLPTSELACLEAITFSAVAAIVEQVPARDFVAETLEQRLQDIGWIAPLARKHADILDRVMQHGTVIPAPLCTLFSASDSVRSSLEANEERFQVLLRSLEGRQEWGLKVFCNAEALQSAIGSGDPELRELDRGLHTASPGKAYVLRKQRNRRLTRLASERIDEVVEEVLDALDSVTVDTRLRALPQHKTFEPAETMVLNAAFLVDVAASGELHTGSAHLASRFSPDGFAFELTGPWPPYSFCGDAAGPPGARGVFEKVG